METIKKIPTSAAAKVRDFRAAASARYFAITSALIFTPMVAIAQSNTGAWAWLDFINSKMGILKTTIIWVFFLLGLVLVGASMLTANKISKGRASEGDTWAAVGIKATAGVFLMAITVFAGGIFSGLTGQSAPNTSSLDQPAIVRSV